MLFNTQWIMKYNFFGSGTVLNKLLSSIPENEAGLTRWTSRSKRNEHIPNVQQVHKACTCIASSDWISFDVSDKPMLRHSEVETFITKYCLIAGARMVPFLPGALYQGT